MMKFLTLVIAGIFYLNNVSAQASFSGKVTTEDGKALAGALVRINEEKIIVQTDLQGMFILSLPNGKHKAEISFTGYNVRSVELIVPSVKVIEFSLTEKNSQLDDVTVVSTGYQTIPKERATGSFVQLNKKMLERSVSTNIISRIQDVTSGLLANKNASSNSTLSIRGKSTLFGNASPLVILDNFPFEGDLNTINPNDVESITILKDASAASIWGARAGNGVIVINSKKGFKNSAPQISLSSSVQIGEKPDAFYGKSMSAADFIEIEKNLFSSGFYKNAETSISQISLTPVIELLVAKRDGKITSADADSQIEALKSYDVRNDIEKYVYRTSISQQYQLSINGGSENHLYYLSAGYDKNKANQINNSDQRITLNANQTNSFFKNRLEIVSGISFLQGNVSNNNQGIITSYPYARLVDENGISQVINRGYRNSFMEAMEAKGFVNWRYNPIDDIGQNSFSTINSEFRVNTMANYKIADFLSVSLQYQFAKSTSEQNNLQGENSYYTRNLVNSFTSVNANGTLTRPIPIGGILDNNLSSGISNNFRSQVNFDKTFLLKHAVSAIAGAEVKQLRTNSRRNVTYGYNEEYVKGSPVDYFSIFPQSYDPTSYAGIPYSDNLARLTDRYLSYFVNASYTFKNRYIFSASSRLDQSNLFGVDANQKGVPLYSTGLGWNISDEEFYKVSFLPYLKLRLTYGHSGNVFKNLSAYTTATYSTGTASPTKLPFAQIENPPNPTLRWEKVKMLNSGVDFGFVGGRVSGSIEYYSKRASDLLGTTPIASSSGITVFSGNSANTKGYGVDIILNTINVKSKMRWNTNLLFSVAEDRVTSYPLGTLNSAYLSGGILPVEGKPINSISSYAWGDLIPRQEILSGT
ncbi:SusC/RagA family TonB-linked outer membrane protein [Pedobacter roseus]|uniref:SusC/RagA family TonB-linked outer membrane protein n=1 Tax=Pedobacter roseus TaxID=336820 RepID=A0A7G9QH86_9SPHI|nr:SusC/RagA family TonB-linked outer membrane protein [Pedobacter roseus]QNN42711.1 SusC/RagA family TonB-linked outer membrane protein [Pedobacter roseus]